MPYGLSIGLLMSISTNLRIQIFPIGPGELILFLWAVIVFYFNKNLVSYKSPITIFWILVLVGMLLGAATSEYHGGLSVRHSMAYVFTSFVTVGIALLLAKLSDFALRRSIFFLSVLAAIILWMGFAIYMTGNQTLIHDFHLADLGDYRYSGWSSNPNQLALFFVPLPVWVAGLWRGIQKPTRFQTVGYGFLLFALMLMGLLVRSDGLFVVWMFEFLILIFLRLRWEIKASRISLLGYALVMILCVILVKTLAHGDVRKSVRCAIETLSENEGAWVKNCYDAKSFTMQEAVRIGYGDTTEKTGLREELWAHGLKAWTQSPWFGHGPGEYSWFAIGANGERSDALESHNITIDMLTQGGLLAGFAWIALVSYLLIHAWRIQDSYTFSVVLMMAAFTFFHNTRQPYLWFVLAMSYEAIRRRLFVSHTSDKA